nr:GNAT family N-acetyltransferase [uncultured Methanospirillum sp.]
MGFDNGVRILSPEEYHLWDDLVRQSPEGSCFHLGQWIERYAELSGKKEHVYGFFREGSLIGGCSGFADKKIMTSFVSSGPMTPYGGFIFAPSDSTKVREKERVYYSIISKINDSLIKNYDYINLINSPGIVDIRPFIWNKWKSSIYYSYTFYLDKNINERISKKVRNTVNKAKKMDISVNKEYNPESYYQLFIRTFEKQHLIPPISKKFLLQMIEMIILNNFGEMWTARTSSGELVAAEIIIWDNIRAYRWSAVLDPRFKDTGATSFLLSSIFQDLFDKGFHEINLMAGNTPQLSKFISGFNPELRFYFGVEYSNFRYNALKVPFSFYKKKVGVLKRFLNRPVRVI